VNNITVIEKGKTGNFDYKIVGLSMTGVSHIKNGTENQDSFGFHRNTNGIVMAIADGVGSCVRAKNGSMYAVETLKTLHDRIDSGQIRSHSNTKIKNFVINEWKSKIDGALSDYSTTLKFAIISASYILFGGIGDGEFFFSIDNNVYLSKNEDDLFSNMTYSLTQDIDESKFEIVKIDLPVDAKVFNIFLATDGITCELQSGMEIEFLNYLATNVRQNSDNYENEIIEWTNTLQKKNGDDKTMLLFTAERGPL
jgi:serine/threonine protein phosphatase PrpC